MRKTILLVVILAAALFVVSCGDDVPAANTTDTELEIAAAVTTTTTILPATTAKPFTTTTTKASTTVTTMSQEAALNRFGSVVEQFAPEIVDLLKDDSLTESVKTLDYDKTDQRVILIMSSKYTGSENYENSRIFYDDQAWYVTQAMAGALYPEGVVDALDGNTPPPFRLELDGIAYQVPGDLMASITEKEVSLEDWLAAAGK